MTVTTDADADSLDEYVHSLADTHGISGYTTTPDGTVVSAAYAGGNYDLRTEAEWLTDAEGDVTLPEWLHGRETLLALRDVDGTEQSSAFTDDGAGTRSTRSSSARNTSDCAHAIHAHDFD